MTCHHTRYHPSTQRMATRPTRPLALAAYEVAAFPPRAPRWSYAARSAFIILSSAACWFVAGCVAWALVSGVREVLHAVAR